VGARIGLSPRLDRRLREANRGEWEGHLFVDIQRADPERFAAWMRGGPSWRFPGGESLQEQQDRVLAALSEIHTNGELPALAVCHGGSIRVVLSARDPRGLDAFHTFEVPNVAVVPL
jgi:probable phosphoglycerate mutase